MPHCTWPRLRISLIIGKKEGKVNLQNTAWQLTQSLFCLRCAWKGKTIAAAHELDATLITGDPELEQLEGQIKLEKLSRTKRS
jgi:hypothetical protein